MLFMHFAQPSVFFIVHYHVSINYFEKAIDIFCDVCYTVITEEKELLRRTQGQAISCILGIPDSTERCPVKTNRMRFPKESRMTYGGLRQWADENASQQPNPTFHP
jgi:hypothetical protein